MLNFVLFWFLSAPLMSLHKFHFFFQIFACFLCSYQSMLKCLIVFSRRTESLPRPRLTSCQRLPKLDNTSSHRWSALMELQLWLDLVASFWSDSRLSKRTTRSSVVSSMDFRSWWFPWRDAWINWKVDLQQHQLSQHQRQLNQQVRIFKLNFDDLTDVLSL